MKCLVTGGAGFIGSHIVAQLLAEGHEVRILDNFSSGKRQNIRPFDGSVELAEADLRDADAVRVAVNGMEIIFHHGAVPSVPRSIADPRTTIDVGVTGTLNVLLAAREAGSRKVVFASSSSVYGDTPESPKHEGMTPHPLSPYAISKLAGEQLCETFSNTYGLETVSLRYFNVYGAGQDPKSEYAAVVPKFIQLLGTGQQPTVFGDGEQARDFVHVDDVVKANLLAADAQGVAGRVFNIASGSATTINEVIDRLATLMGISVRPTYADPRPGDIRHSVADVRSAREGIGFVPGVAFQKGLERMLAMSGDRVAHPR